MSYTKEEQVYLRKIGEKIRFIREQKGYSQEELGFESNVHRTYVGAIERGERNISILSLRKLASALGTTVAAVVNID